VRGSRGVAAVASRSAGPRQTRLAQARVWCACRGHAARGWRTKNAKALGKSGGGNRIKASGFAVRWGAARACTPMWAGWTSPRTGREAVSPRADWTAALL